MKTKIYLFAVVLLTVSFQLSSCKKEASNLATTATKVQPHAANLSSFSQPLVVSLYAGSFHTQYSYRIDEVPRLDARFDYLTGIVASSSGGLYVTDPGFYSGPSSVDKIYPDGMVYRLPQQVSPDGISLIPYNLYADYLVGLTRGNDGLVYFIETDGFYPDLPPRIRSIDRHDQILPAWLVTCKLVNGIKQPYVFSHLSDLAVAADKTMYLCDDGANRIIKRTPDGIGTVFAGGTRGYKDGKGTDAQFNEPTDIAIDSFGNLYVVDLFNYRIRKITPDGTVTTLAGSSTPGFKDGIGADVQFKSLTDVIVADDNTLLVSDGYDLRRIDLTTNQVTTIAGGTTLGFVNGPALSAQFEGISQIAISNGNIYVIDQHSMVRQIAPQ